MGKDDFAKDLIQILDEAMNLIRQDLVTLRNDVMQQKIQMTNCCATIETLKEDRVIRSKLLAVIVGGAIAAITSLSVAVIEFFKK